ncbi:MAG: 1-deoxy-D-xylulose-5-phosphate reductoisomerase [Coriobacteriia bacterium]|nr:1-deoxy-D-xylulose-5-phosphate reductoisomerase [Coriobacteriia bacterium]
MKTVAILGSTGSIGKQTLDVVKNFPEEFRVVALGAFSSYESVAQQARQFTVNDLAMAQSASAERLSSELPACNVGSGDEAMVELIERSNPDIVINALVGSAGLRVTAATLKAGKRLGLANKESLVVGGDIIIPLAAPGQLIPVDSEHSAIFQCLLGESPSEISRIWVTASGGPFRDRDRTYLASVKKEQALAHPTWNMGAKITIDSSTLMNKGLEVIEAHHLFDMDYDSISVVVQPQSRVHSMVEYLDGSVKAHLGVADMRIPIQYALSYPKRFASPVAPLDFTCIGSLDFFPPDTDTFRCLDLAYAAGRLGGTAPVVLNAANEIAVAAFLQDRIGFLDIEHIVEESLSHFDVEPVESIEHIEQVDARTRIFAEKLSVSL